MGHYVVATPAEQRRMLEALGLDDIGQLYQDTPRQLCLSHLDIPPGCSELETEACMTELAGQNRIFRHIFRGAGAYDHYIPAIVRQVTAKEEFVTAYTPYQAEISQGLLQSIFEYQTMICELTGMDAANASVYDGATAAAEAAMMCRGRGRKNTLASACLPPDVIAAIRAYHMAAGDELILIPARDGRTDLAALVGLLDETVASVILGQPNYFGQLEDMAAAAELAHGAGAKLVAYVNPISLGLLQTPAALGADIAVGEGQPLGMPLAFGGPYLGFMAAKAALTRQLPGRIVGETVDHQGRRGYVLTLQAREQHIKREKAGSSICSNQALCALTAAVYLSALGPQGLRQAARLCLSKAHYLAAKLAAIPGVSLAYGSEFFHEFVTELPFDATSLLEHLAAHDILGGLALDERHILWCCTEKNSQAAMDQLAGLIAEYAKGVA